MLGRLAWLDGSFTGTSRTSASSLRFFLSRKSPVTVRGGVPDSLRCECDSAWNAAVWGALRVAFRGECDRVAVASTLDGFDTDTSPVEAWLSGDFDRLTDEGSNFGS